MCRHTAKNLQVVLVCRGEPVTLPVAILALKRLATVCGSCKEEYNWYTRAPVEAIK